MEFYKIVGIAIALAVDASIVAFSYGLILRTFRLCNALKLALITGTFQALMPLLGFWFTGKIRHYIEACDHWVAFGVFATLGGIVIFNAWRAGEEDDIGKTQTGTQSISFKKLLGIGIATSIDALAVGAGMACIVQTKDAPFCAVIGVPAAVIGGITFLCVFAAFYSTHLFKNFPKRALETAAGTILIALGVLTLIQHLCE